MRGTRLKLPRHMLAALATLLIAATPLVVGVAGEAPQPTYDLARDWSLQGVPLKGMPFGPDDVWSVCAVQFKPDWKWESFDRAMHFSISNPWLDLYGIDGWWLGSSPIPRKPMAGENVGGGNIPGMVHGVNYDWPRGRVAVLSWPNSDQDKGKLTMTAVVWTAPRPMVVRVAGGIWMAGEYQEFTERRTRAMLWINRPATAANRILFQDVVVPLWTEGYDSKNPQTFAAILGNEAAQLESIAVEKGDRIAVGFYWDDKALKPGLSGIDIQITAESGR